MKCPKCGAEISARNAPHGFRHGCPVCGWTSSQRDRRHRPKKEGELAVSPGQWIVCWILAIAFVFGPYIAIWLLKPPWATQQFFVKDYWLGWGVYLLVTLVLSPNPDMDNLGYFGGLVDNPYHWKDDWNRFQVGLVLLLTPGKIFLAALLGTPRYLMLILRGQAKTRELQREARRRRPRRP